jgi:hypothetical protein
MSRKGSKGSNGAAAKNAAVRRAERAGIRLDMIQTHDPGVGTSPASLGLVKMQSEEARLQTCPECGSSGGRHMRVCSRQ